MLAAAKDAMKVPADAGVAAADASVLICSKSAPNTASMVAGVDADAGAAAVFTAVTVDTSTTLEVRESCGG
jgi:hypothetical protein